MSSARLRIARVVSRPIDVMCGKRTEVSWDLVAIQTYTVFITIENELASFWKSCIMPDVLLQLSRKSRKEREGCYWCDSAGAGNSGQHSSFSAEMSLRERLC